MRAPLPRDEAARLDALREYGVLDTIPEAAYDDLTRLASHICGTPIALITLIDQDRQWFKSAVGLDVPETSRDVAFCAHTILQREVVVVRDALQDPRFADNPFVTEAPHIRFYAAAPLLAPSGHALGSLCVIDDHPRDLEPDQRDALLALARQVMAQLELRRHVAELEAVVADRDRAERELRERAEQSTRYQTVLLDLARSEEAEPRAALGRITRADAHAIGVGRVGIWLFSEDGRELVCQDLYLADEDRHEAGATLRAEQLPGYFAALHERRAIAARDALADPATREFADDYLRPLGIASMLDVPIWRDGRMVGVVCHEQVGPPRTWTLDEQEFAASVADLVARALESADRREAERGLRERERQLTETQRLARLGSWEWDAASDTIRWSDEMYRIYGLEPGGTRVSFDTFLQRVHPEDRDRVQGAIGAAYDSGGSFRFEHRAVRPDGSVRVVICQGEVMRSADGGPARMVGFGQDVTELAAAEEVGRRSERRFRTMFEQFPFSIQIFAPDGQTLEVNRAWERLFGMTPEQVQGFNPMQDPELEPIRAMLERGFAGESQSIPPHPFVPPPARGGNGASAVAPRWLEVSVCPVQDGTGVGEVIVVHQDVTERTRAEEQLRASETRYRALVEASTQAVWTATGESGWDPETTAWWLELTGQSSEDATGWGWLDALHPDDRGRARAEWERALANCTGYRNQYRVRTRAGDYLHLDVRGVPVEREGEAREWVGTFTDVTDLKRAEEALRTAYADLERRVVERTAELAEVNEALEEEVAEHEAAREELQERTRELEAIFQALPDLYFRLEGDARIVDYRAGAKWGLFVPPSEFLGKCMREVFPPELAQRFDRVFAEVRRTGTLGLVEYMLPLHDEPRHFEARIVPLGDDGDMIAVVRDVTEHVLAEVALQEREEHFRRLVENSSDVAAIVGPDGVNLYQSPAVTGVLGYLPEELVGTTPFERIHPQDVPTAQERLADAFRQPGTIHAAELRYRHKDGRWLTLDLRAKTLLPDSPAAGVVVNYRDITDRKEAEAALRASEEHFRALIENASDLTLILEPSGRLRYQSPSVRHILGYAPEELHERNSFEYIHPDDFPAVAAEVERVLANPGVTGTAEYRFRHRDGSWRIMEAKGRTLTTSTDGMQIVINARDITERKRSEQALRASEESYRSLFDALTELVYIQNLEGRFLNVNEAVIRAYGYTRDELVGETPEILADPDRVDIADTMERFGRAVSGEPQRFEWWGRRKDGSTFPKELVLTRATYFGQTAVIAVARDITERKEAENELRFQKTLLEAQGETSIDGILVVSEEGEMLSFNRRFVELWGIPRDVVEGRSDNRALQHVLNMLDDPDAFLARVTYLYEHGDETSRDEIRLRDGRVFDRYSAPVRNGEDGRYGRIWFFRDVTENRRFEEALRRAKEEAEQANRAKSEFLSRMSHELRTPMNSILGFGQLLARADLPPDQRKGVQHILTAGRHLLTLINEVLDIARIEAGRQPFSLEAVRVDSLLQEAAGLVRPIAEQRAIRITPLLAGVEPMFVHADRQRLAQVMLNVLSNAVKYNRDGGQIILSCERVAGDGGAGLVRIRVEDTGHGVPAERRSELFVPFARLGAEQSGVEGTGLGLALSKRLVEAMGGTLELERSSAAGSVFRIDLRLSRNPLDRVALPTEPASASPRAAQPPATVLYVEDNLANLALVETILFDRPEWTIIPALQGQIGVELAREHAPDLILLDLHLPDISGEEVLRRLRSDERTARTPVVIISADATNGTVDRLHAAGADAYLTKPLDVDDFVATVERLLRRGER